MQAYSPERAKILYFKALVQQIVLVDAINLTLVVKE